MKIILFLVIALIVFTEYEKRQVMKKKKADKKRFDNLYKISL